MTEKETDIQRSICDHLSLRKHFFWRTNTTPIYDVTRQSFRAMPKYALKGVPDIIVIDDTGRFIGLECKKKGSYQSSEQKDFEKRCKEKGAEYYVVRSIDDVKNIGL